MRDDTENDLWVFGYGSLIWRPDFPFTDTLVGYVAGWARRFYQGSIDHRGTPGAPGRVVTLVAQPQTHCWGMAFRVAAEQKPKVLKELDHREKGGYHQKWLPFHPRADRSEVQEIPVLTYWAGPENPNYLGPASLDAMAGQIYRASGPSGKNAAYLLHLEAALNDLGIADDHVSSLSGRVRQIQKQPMEDELV